VAPRHRIETQLIHAGEPRPRIEGAISTPIFQSAMFEYANEGSYHELRYIRLNNTPNHVVLHQKLAAIEGAEAALVTASGMAAISTVLLTLLHSGDHLLAQNCLYGGTYDLLTKDFNSLGIDIDFFDADDRDAWQGLLRPTTRAIYVESMSNPLLEVADLTGVVEFARTHGLVSIVDNTFASPVNFKPVGIGFDLVIHSATKYLNGHSDIVGGAIAGGAALLERITRKLNHLGGCMDPHAAFLLDRGIKTLALRMRQHNASALRIAQFLESHGAVRRVNYPGLQTHPRHQRAASLFSGFGGVLSFELDGTAERAERFLARTTLPAIAPSLGGIETLLTRPATTSHSGLAPVERQRLGISDRLIRLSVGIEATEDLIEDLNQALE
jgi:cystathionine beta-lyase/cystathionine gamma-synthase